MARTLRGVQAYKQLYGTQQWRKTSKLVIARADGRCEVTRGCARPATTADHLIPAVILAERGRLDLFFSVDLLVAACRSCNSARGAPLSSRHGRRRRPTAEERAIAWAAEYAAWQQQVARERQEPARRAPTPAIH